MCVPVICRAALVSVVGLLLLTGAGVARADELCEDPSGEWPPFICGQLVVTLTATTDDPIEVVIARSAPRAEVVTRPDPNPPGYRTPGYFRTYGLEVPIGTELATRDTLLQDPAVEAVFVVHQGQTTPNTAMPRRAPAPIVALGAVLLVLAIVARALTRRTLREGDQAETGARTAGR
jgi:hypothetical protein